MADVKQVLTIFRADTSQQEAAVKRMRGVERGEAKKTLDDLNAQNAKLADQIAMIGKAGIALGAVAVAWQTAKAAAKVYLEDVRLESAAAGANLEGLQKATRGLVEADTLLAFAGKSMNGVWKLNQSEMEVVLRGATALQKTMGVELQPTIEKLTMAISKGMTEELKEFGIVAKDKVGLLEQLDRAYAAVGGSAALAGEDFTRSQVALSDAIRDLQSALGRLVIALAPVIDGLAGAVDLINNAIAGWAMLFGGESPWETQRKQNVAQLNAQTDQHLNTQYGAMHAKRGVAELRVWARQNPSHAGLLLDLLEAASKKPEKKKAGRAGRGGDELVIEAPDYYSMLRGRSGLGLGQTGVGRSAGDGLAGSQVMGDLRLQQAFASMEGVQGKFLAAQEAFRLQDQRTLMARIFGTPAEIEATAEAIRLAASATDVLTSASVAGFDAWMTGADSVSGALRKAFGEGLRALANDLWAQATRHSLYALGSLAFGDFAGAGRHGAAAAAYGAGAVSVGLVAREMGAGQSSRPSVGSGARSSGGSGIRPLGGSAGSGERTSNVTVILGGGVSGLPERQQRALYLRNIRRAMRSDSGTIYDG